MKYISIHELKTKLDDDGLLTKIIEKCIDSMNCVNLRTQYIAIPRVKDLEFNGESNRIVGDDPAHDWLQIVDGSLCYRNMQNGDGTPIGYEFIPTYECDYGGIEQYITPELVYMVMSDVEEQIEEDEYEEGGLF